MKRVIIESPYAGDVDANLAYARACLKDSLNRGEAPIATHLLYTQPGVLDDDKPDERALGIDAGHAWISAADLVVVYHDMGVTEGMQAGIRRAWNAGKTVEFRKLDDRPALVVREGKDDLIAKRLVTTSDADRYEWDGVIQDSAEAMATGGITTLTASFGPSEGFNTTEGEATDDTPSLLDLAKWMLSTLENPERAAERMLIHLEATGRDLPHEVVKLIASYIPTLVWARQGQEGTEAAQNG